MSRCTSSPIILTRSTVMSTVCRRLPPEQEPAWYRVAEAEYLRLVGSAQRHEATLLDQYGATNRVEFFAVATEYFRATLAQCRGSTVSTTTKSSKVFTTSTRPVASDAKVPRDRRIARED